MAESYSVKAILSATDKGFSSTLKNANKVTDSLGQKIKSGFSFGILTGMGQQAFSTLTNGARNLVGEISSANAAWKTFEGNMGMLGKGSKEIKGIKKELQAFAEQTIYSSSDMASTYAQLAAVGTKNCTKLVKGFGGLASAAENPKQAMKTLSMQATQMAAKPKVAWMDFKLMLEQTPAGIAAVAKEMGMTTSELVKNVQDGTVATDEFFDAIAKVGTNKAFTKLATEYKTVGQAMDGLQETIGNKLTPAFDVLSKKAIKGIDGIITKIGKIDGEALAEKVSAGLKKAEPYWQAFMKVVSATGKILKKVGGFFVDHANIISKMIPVLIGAVVAYKGFKIVSKVVKPVAKFSKALTSLSGKGISGLAGKLFGISKAQKKVGKTSAVSAKQMTASAKAFMMMGVAVLTIAAGFALLAFSAIALADAGGMAIAVMAGLAVGLAGLGLGMGMLLKFLAPMGAQLMPVATAMILMGVAVLIVSAGFMILAQAAIALASAGTPAIVCMLGMVTAIGLLAAGAAALAPALTAGAIGFIAFGAAIALVGVGALLASNALKIVAGVLPIVCQYGVQGAISIAALGAAMVVFALGATLAGVACIALAAGLLLVSAGILLAAVGVGLLAAGMVLLGTGAMMAGLGLSMVATALPTIASSGVKSALAMAAIALGLGTLSAAAMLAGVAMVALGAGLTLVTVGLALVSAGILLASVAVLAFATTALVLGAGLTVCSTAFMSMAAVLPMLSAGVLMLVASFAGLLATSIGISATLLVTSATMAALAVAAAAAGVAIIAFGAGIILAGAGTLILSAGLALVNSTMKSIAKNAKQTVSSLKTMTTAINLVKSGLDAIGSKAKGALKKLLSAFDSTASKAIEAGRKVGTGFSNGVKVGLLVAQVATIAATALIISALNKTASKAKSAGTKVGNGFSTGAKTGFRKAVTAASQATSQVASKLRAGHSRAYSAGAYISQGFANGMRSQLGSIRSAAAQIAAAADKAVRAKAKIHSPSKVSTKLGSYWGQGMGNGILDMFRYVKKASEKLVNIPNIATPNLAMAYAGEMSADYEYYRNAVYTIVVPVEIDGREVARTTAPYTQEELDKRQSRDSRKRGKL